MAFIMTRPFKDPQPSCQLWFESDALGVNAAQNAMSGKGCARTMLTHKLTLQTPWQLLPPQLYAYLDSVDTMLTEK